MKDWKTTVFGIAGGILNLLANGQTLKNALLSTALAFLGYYAADSQKPHIS